jgi:Flp pilus assembly protein TadD
VTELRRASKALRIAMTGILSVSLISTAVIAKAPDAAKSALRAQAALAKGQFGKAIALAEAAVAASPRDAALRVMLGHAYLKAGRFASAGATFNDAMDLGDTNPRTALALALANAAAGNNAEAIAVLDDWRDSIPASDLGLAYALAGEGGRGVAVLSDGLRAGDNSPKLRQNLAYAYALDGRWREARTMASQDLVGDKLDERIGEWAAASRPEDHQLRIAALLGVPMTTDAGQPARLALAAPAPDATAQSAGEQLAAAAPLPVPAEIAVPDAPLPAEQAAVASAEAPAIQLGFVSEPVVQPIVYHERPRTAAGSALAVRSAHAGNSPVARTARIAATGGSHSVQLGAFSSEQNAQRAKTIFASRNPELRSVRMTITPAVVHGRNVWRVAVAGYDNRSAIGLCSAVKGRGGACFAYAATNPPRSDPAQGTGSAQMARRR